MTDTCVKCGADMPVGCVATWLREPERKGYYHPTCEAKPTAGWSSLTTHRYWPSSYILSSRGEDRSAYIPDFKVQLMGVKL